MKKIFATLILTLLISNTSNGLQTTYKDSLTIQVENTFGFFGFFVSKNNSI